MNQVSWQRVCFTVTVATLGISACGGGSGNTRTGLSSEYEAGYQNAYEGGLAYKLLAGGASAEGACRTATGALAVDLPELDLEDYNQGCLDGMEAQGWR